MDGYTQLQVAEALGINQATVSRWQKDFELWQAKIWKKLNTTLFGFYPKQWSYAKSDVTIPLGYGLRLGFLFTMVHQGGKKNRAREYMQNFPDFEYDQGFLEFVKQNHENHRPDL